MDAYTFFVFGGILWLLLILFLTGDCECFFSNVSGPRQSIGHDKLDWNIIFCYLVGRWKSSSAIWLGAGNPPPPSSFYRHGIRNPTDDCPVSPCFHLHIPTDQLYPRGKEANLGWFPPNAIPIDGHWSFITNNISTSSISSFFFHSLGTAAVGRCIFASYRIIVYFSWCGSELVETSGPRIEKGSKYIQCLERPLWNVFQCPYSVSGSARGRPCLVICILALVTVMVKVFTPHYGGVVPLYDFENLNYFMWVLYKNIKNS